MAIALLDNGLTGIISGSINGSAATDAVLTSTDGAATLTATGSGVQTVTFGASFNSAPAVTANCVDATFAATDGPQVVVIAAVSTDAVTFNTATTGGSAANGALADLDFHFMVIGSRNR